MRSTWCLSYSPPCDTAPMVRIVWAASLSKWRVTHYQGPVHWCHLQSYRPLICSDTSDCGSNWKGWDIIHSRFNNKDSHLLVLMIHTYVYTAQNEDRGHESSELNHQFIHSAVSSCVWGGEAWHRRRWRVQILEVLVCVMFQNPLFLVWDPGEVQLGRENKLKSTVGSSRQASNNQSALGAALAGFTDMD